MRSFAVKQIHKSIQLVSTNLHLRFNSQTVELNCQVEIEVKLSHERKRIWREFWQLVELVKSVMWKKMFKPLVF